jgi:hypothetical protein
MRIEVSNGELVDKLTILELKRANIADPSKLSNIDNELSYLVEHFDQLKIEIKRETLKNVMLLKDKLFNVNQKLWDIEDSIRDKEANKEFDEEFIELARSVYIINDERAYLKKEINLLTDSNLVEEKSYKQY